VIEADVLSVDLAQWGPAPIAGNLPYYIASPILERALRLFPPRAVFLLQRKSPTAWWPNRDRATMAT